MKIVVLAVHKCIYKCLNQITRLPYHMQNVYSISQFVKYLRDYDASVYHTVILLYIHIFIYIMLDVYTTILKS